MSMLADRKWLFAVVLLQVVLLVLLQSGPEPKKPAPPANDSVPDLADVMQWPSQRPPSLDRDLAGYLAQANANIAEARKWYQENVDANIEPLSNEEVRQGLMRIVRYPETPESDRQAALEQALKLTGNGNYAEMEQLMGSADTPRSVQERLFDDLVSRDPELKLKTALDLAKNETSPLSDRARELLRFQTQEDHGANWKAWETAVQKSVAANQAGQQLASPASSSEPVPIVN